MRIALTAGIAGALLALPAAAENAPIACADLAALYAPEVLITSATLVPAVPSGDNSGPEAAYDGVGNPTDAASFACRTLD